MSQPMRRSMTIHRSRTTPYRRSARGTASGATADAGAILTILQVCVCMVALVVVFTLQFLDEERYAQAGELYQAVMGGGEGEAVFVGAFGTPITKDTLEDYARELWELAQPDETAAVPEPSDVQPDTPQPQSSSLGQGGESPFLPQNLYLGQVALMADPTYPVYGTVTSAFGLRTHPTSGKADFHTGLDIAAKAQADVYAVLPGVVTEAGQSPIYGNYIRVDHGGGVITVYNHCSAILAREGMVVRRGQRIAQVGSTGVSTGPHLHLDLFINGDYADPMQLFKELL